MANALVRTHSGARRAGVTHHQQDPKSLPHQCLLSPAPLGEGRVVVGGGRVGPPTALLLPPGAARDVLNARTFWPQLCPRTPPGSGPLCILSVPQSTRLLPPASILPGIRSTRPSGHFQTVAECASSFFRSSFTSLKIANTSPDVRVVARPLDPGPEDLPNPGIKPKSLMSPEPSLVHLHPEHIRKPMEKRMLVARSQGPSAASRYLPCFSQHENRPEEEAAGGDG